MSKKAKKKIGQESFEAISAGAGKTSEYLYWVKVWIDTKTKSRSRTIISRMPGRIRPVPYSEGNFNIKFEGPYLTQDEALTKSSMGG